MVRMFGMYQNDKIGRKMLRNFSLTRRSKYAIIIKLSHDVSGSRERR